MKSTLLFCLNKCFEFENLQTKKRPEADDFTGSTKHFEEELTPILKLFLCGSVLSIVTLISDFILSSLSLFFLASLAHGLFVYL